MARDKKFKSLPSIQDPRLGPYDILCGRSRNSYNNVGNRRFRVSIRIFLQRYQRLDTRADRKVFIFDLTRLFREEIDFRFLKKDGEEFRDIGEIETRKKIGHALLDQTMKNSSREPATTTATATTPRPVLSSTPPILFHKVSVVKKPSRPSIKPSLRTIPTTTEVDRSTQTIRRVSLVPFAALESRQLLPSPRDSEDVKVIPVQPAVREESVTKLESEICMLLIGMHKQPQSQRPQCIA